MAEAPVVVPTPPKEGGRIPQTLQAVFLASNRGNDVHKPPPKQVAFKTFFRNFMGKGSKEKKDKDKVSKKEKKEAAAAAAKAKKKVADPTKPPRPKAEKKVCYPKLKMYFVCF